MDLEEDSDYDYELMDLNKRKKSKELSQAKYDNLVDAYKATQAAWNDID